MKRSDALPYICILTNILWVTTLNLFSQSSNFVILTSLDKVAHYSTLMSLVLIFSRFFRSKSTLLGWSVILLVGWEVFEAIAVSVFGLTTYIFGTTGITDVTLPIYAADTLTDIVMGLFGILTAIGDPALKLKAS